MDQTVAELWAFLPRGYLLTIVIEIGVLLVGLSQDHSFGRRFVAGCWLTACTYPIVDLVLPLTIRMQWGEAAYLIVAETFAPVAECLLFRAAYPIPSKRFDTIRDVAAITTANLASFLIGLWIFA